MGVLDNPESVVFVASLRSVPPSRFGAGNGLRADGAGRIPAPRVSREACAALAQRRNRRVDCQAHGRARRLIPKTKRPPVAGRARISIERNVTWNLPQRRPARQRTKRSPTSN